jgi:predicted RNA-binding Zn-ribbon protein involved in translation (DUF1610 family)
MNPTYEYYDEFQWCPSCRRKVNYLRSMTHSYCADCGGMVRMFRDRKEAADFLRDCTPVQPVRWSKAPPA